MTEKIKLPPYMRTLLLAEICKRMDIIDYCISWLHIHFDPGLRDTRAAACCPYCGKSDVFYLNKKTGKYFCKGCGNEGDFLDVMCERERNDLTGTLYRLTGYLEHAEKRVGYLGGVK